MHQDGLSERFCGEGIPMWAGKTYFFLFLVETERPINVFGIHLPKSLVGFPFPLSYTPFTILPDGRPSRQDCAKFGW